MPDHENSYTWNGWEIDVSADGNTVKGRKDSPFGGELVTITKPDGSTYQKASPVLTVTTTSGDATEPEIGLLAAMAAMADEDVRVGGDPGIGLYWNAVAKLYRQHRKEARGEELVDDELLAQMKYRRVVRANAQHAGDISPVVFDLGV